MIYLINSDKLLLELNIHYKEIISLFDKDLIDDFIDNCAIINGPDIKLNIEYVNDFKYKYNDIFKYIMTVTNTRTV